MRELIKYERKSKKKIVIIRRDLKLGRKQQQKSERANKICMFDFHKYVKWSVT